MPSVHRKKMQIALTALPPSLVSPFRILSDIRRASHRSNPTTHGGWAYSFCMYINVQTTGVSSHPTWQRRLDAAVVWGSAAAPVPAHRDVRRLSPAAGRRKAGEPGSGGVAIEMHQTAHHLITLFVLTLRQTCRGLSPLLVQTTRLDGKSGVFFFETPSVGVGTIHGNPIYTLQPVRALLYQSCNNSCRLLFHPSLVRIASFFYSSVYFVRKPIHAT